MTSVYSYYVGAPPTIATQVALMDSKLSIDLEIPNYVSTVYNSGTQLVEVTFSAPLGYIPVNTLNNLATLIFFGGILGDTVYTNDFNTGNRRSFGVASGPTVDHDAKDCYAIGSMVITTGNVIYICSDNTPGAAVWVQVS